MSEIIIGERYEAREGLFEAGEVVVPYGYSKTEDGRTWIDFDIVEPSDEMKRRGERYKGGSACPTWFLERYHAWYEAEFERRLAGRAAAAAEKANGRIRSRPAPARRYARG